MMPADRLPLAQKSLNVLIDQLRPQDRVSLVAYAGSAGAVLGPTDGRDKLKIRCAVEALQSGGSTAGGAGLSLAYALAEQNFDKQAVNRVVLMTDGIPTDQGCKNVNKDGTDDYAANACVKMAKSELVAKAPASPVETFVIGVGPLPGDFATYDPYFLAELAVAGGSAPPGCNPRSNVAGAKDLCYFNIDPTGATAEATQKAFTDALDAIRGQVVSCTLGITPQAGGTIDPEKVNVLLNEATVAQDETDGWTYDDPNQPTSVTLHGAACETLKSDPAAKISIVLGCVTKKVVK
jgi:hypothetical protein